MLGLKTSAAAHARTVFYFAYRISRIKQEALLKHYPPELMNRFLDVPLLQKGMAIRKTVLYLQ